MEDERQSPQQDREHIDVAAELATWQKAHPRATFAEMEDGVRGILNRLRPQLLDQLTSAQPVPDGPCPVCGGALAKRGQRTRSVLLEDGTMLPLRRSYAVCPTCGTGLFPPG